MVKIQWLQVTDFGFLMPATLVPPAQPNPVRTKLKLLGDAVIARGTNEKRRILDEYKQKFRKNYDDSIVSKKKGKITDDPPMQTCTTRMKPSLDKWYWVSKLTILNDITAVIKEHCFTPSELKTMRLLDKSFSIKVPKVLGIMGCQDQEGRQTDGLGCPDW